MRARHWTAPPAAALLSLALLPGPAAATVPQPTPGEIAESIADLDLRGSIADLGLKDSIEPLQSERRSAGLTRRPV